MDFNDGNPLLSICVVTYNQKDLIGRCLQSILDQAVGQPFEVIVGDDESTDGTRDIVRAYGERYPGLVKPLLHPTNVGAGLNYRLVHRQARGTFVAHVDGDDFILPGKLGKQIGFLQQNPQCPLVAHRMRVAKNGVPVSATRSNPPFINLECLLLGNPLFLNSSIMYRRDLVGEVFHRDFNILDFYVYVFAALRGDLGFINEILGEYAANIGISSKNDLMPSIHAAILQARGAVPESTLQAALCRQQLSYAIASLMQGNAPGFNLHLDAALATKSKGTILFALHRLRSFPWLLRPAVAAYKALIRFRYRLGMKAGKLCHG